MECLTLKDPWSKRLDVIKPWYDIDRLKNGLVNLMISRMEGNANNPVWTIVIHEYYGRRV